MITQGRMAHNQRTGGYHNTVNELPLIRSHDDRWPYLARVAWIVGTSVVLWIGVALIGYVLVCGVREVAYALGR